MWKPRTLAADGVAGQEGAMMDANEEYVRSAWETVTVVANPNSKPYWIHSRTTYLGEGPFTSEDEMWAAAAEFTRTREEEIRQVRRQIEWVKQFIFDLGTDYPNGVIFIQEEEPTIDEQLEGTAERAREDATGLLLVTRLEFALANLTRGMTVRP